MRLWSLAKRGSLSNGGQRVFSACPLVVAALLALACFTSCSRAPRKAELIVGVEEEPSSVDPRAGSDQASDRLFKLLYRGLFKPGPHLEPEPDLASSWEQVSPLIYRVRVAPGMRFSNGKPLTARDAAFTIESIRTGMVASYRKGDMKKIASAAAVSNDILEIRLNEPFSPILLALDAGIVPEGTPPDSAVPPPGCGAYVLKERVPGQWLVFEANPFAVPAPKCSTIAFKVIPDPVVRALELKRGSVDMVVNDLPPDSVAAFAKKGYTVARSNGTNYAYLGFNCAKAPLDRAGVRRALAMAIDRDSILKWLYHDLGRPASGLLSPENWAFNPAAASIPFDPARAEALLDASGLKKGPDGARLRLTYKTSQNKVSRQLAVAIQGQLARVGVKIEIQSLEWGTFYGDVLEGRFDIYGLTWVGITDPDAFRLRFASNAFPPYGLNRGHYSNRSVDRLVETGATEPDPAKRKAIYAEVQSIIAADVPYVSLWWPDNIAVAQPGLAPFVVPPDGSFAFLASVGWNFSQGDRGGQGGKGLGVKK